MPMNNYTFTFNNLTIGKGTSFLITNIEGLGGTPPLRIQDDNRGYLDGSYTGRDFYDERTVYLDITVLGDATHSAQANYLRLQSAFAPQPLGYYYDPTGFTPSVDMLKQFYFRLSGAPEFTGDSGDRFMWGRSRGLVTPVDPDFTYGYIQTRLMMSFPDPRYYSDVVTPAASSTVTMTNYGWAISCPIIYISSGVSSTSGYITDGTNTMSFSNMPLGSSVIIDLLSRVIYVDGIPTRNVMSANSTWLQLNPNSTTTFSCNFGSMLIPYSSAYV